MSIYDLPVRRKGMRLLVPGLLLLSSPAFALQPLDAFVKSALQHNPDALEAKANLDQQNAQHDLAFGRVLPGCEVCGVLRRGWALPPPPRELPAAQPCRGP